MHDLSASERPLPQSAARPPTGLFAPSITSASSTTTVAASVRSATDRAGSGDWEGQRWDLGLISDVDLAQGTIEFDREQIVDPNGTFQSGPTITSEPMIRRPSELKNENTRLRTFVLGADLQLLRPTDLSDCPTAAAADWKSFALADLLAVRSQDPQTALSFDQSGHVVRMRLFHTC